MGELATQIEPTPEDVRRELGETIVVVSCVGALVGGVLDAVLAQRRGPGSEIVRQVGLTLFALPFAELGLAVVAGACSNLRARMWRQGLGALSVGIIFAAAGIWMIVSAWVIGVPPDSGDGDGGGGD